MQSTESKVLDLVRFSDQREGFSFFCGFRDYEISDSGILFLFERSFFEIQKYQNKEVIEIHEQFPWVL